MTLQIKDVRRSFGGIKALDGCSMDIQRGKITAIIGPNGSGKSTLFAVISNLLKKHGGRIVFDGVDITGLPDFRIAKMGLSRTFQDVRLFRNLTVRDHLEIALSCDDEELVRGLFRRAPDNLKRINDVLAKVHLEKPVTTFATDLSYGQRKLLDLAVAIAKPHTLLLLDEPVAGVNPRLRHLIKDILRALNKEGETILLIEHDMNFVMDLADQVIVMDDGTVIAHGRPEEIQNDRKVLAAYLGE